MKCDSTPNRSLRKFLFTWWYWGLFDFDLDAAGFGLVVVAVDGGDGVAVFAGCGGQVAFRVAGGAEDF